MPNEDTRPKIRIGVRAAQATLSLLEIQLKSLAFDAEDQSELDFYIALLRVKMLHLSAADALRADEATLEKILNQSSRDKTS